MQKPSPSAIPDRPFGDDRTWADVISHVSRIIREKFPIFDHDMLQDVLGDVLVDLLGYWSTLPSSRQEDGTFSFRYAIQRGCWMGKRKMWEAQRYNARHRRTAFDEQDGGNGYYGDDWGQSADEEESEAGAEEYVRYISLIAHLHFKEGDEDPTPETVVTELDETDRARQLLASLSPEELESYFDTILTDETMRDTATRKGTSVSTQHRHVEAARHRLRDRATKFGLVP